MWRYEGSECPCGAPGEPAERIRELQEEGKKERTYSWLKLKGTVTVVFAMFGRRARSAAATQTINAASHADIQ